MDSNQISSDQPTTYLTAITDEENRQLAVAYVQKISMLNSNAQLKYEIESQKLKGIAVDAFEMRQKIVPQIKSSIVNQMNISDKQNKSLEKLSDKLLDAIEEDDFFLINKYTLAIEKVSKSLRNIVENTKDTYQILGLSSNDNQVKIDLFNNASFENISTGNEENKIINYDTNNSELSEAPNNGEIEDISFEL